MTILEKKEKQKFFFKNMGGKSKLDYQLAQY